MITGLLIFFFSGLFAGNGVPHFVKGVSGAKHKTPFRTPSSAPVNVLWGALNFLAAFWLGVWAARFGVSVPLAGTSVIVGMTLCAFFLALHWRNDPAARGE